MRIPPLYRKPAWQRFLAGTIVGGCISWVIFLFMFGTIQERQTKIIENQQSTISNLKGDIDIWRKDYKELNRKQAGLLTIQTVKINILEDSAKKYGIEDELSILEAEEQVKDLINPLVIAKELNTVYENKDPIIKLLENKTIKIHGRRYKLVIKNIIFFTTISIDLTLELD